MKNLLLTFLLFAFAISAQSQNASVEKSTYGIQTGFLGIWGYNEMRLSDEFALRTEIGLDAGISSSSYLNKTGFILIPTIHLEPRWYYNLNKRERKSRRIAKNTGNFLSLKTIYRPDLFAISNYDNVSVVPNIAIMPTWGIRRHIGNHFNYEAGFGLGYGYVFAKSAGYMEDESGVAVNLHIRLGYSF